MTVTPLEVFEATCEALDVPVGAFRFGAFMLLPESQRLAIARQLEAEAERDEAAS